jgi:hypothetical protein
MPTPNMSDEELDSLFQRGAEAYPDDNYLAGWEGMETKLNTATKAQALRQKVRRLFAAEILVLSLLLWQGYEFTRSVTATEPLPPTALLQAKRANHPLALRAAAGAPVANKDASSDAAVAVHADKMTGSAAATNSPVQQAQQLVGQQGGVGSSSVITLPMQPNGLIGSRVRGSLSTAGVVMPHRRHTKASSSTAHLPEKAQRHTNPTTTQKAQRAGQVKFENSTDGTSASGFLSTSLRSRTLTRAKVDSLRPLSTALTTGALGLSLPDAPVQLAVHQPTDSAAAKKRPVVRPAYRVVIGLLGAPAASAVRTAQSARLGGDVGLTLEYRFTNRLRVRTGLISSEKRYEALSTDYTVPASWQWYNSYYEVDGSCRVTEIPIDLRYDVLSRPAYMVFASVGLNSLFMRDERYSYDWIQNGQTFTKEAHVVDGSHHVLSVLNFSAGVERKLGARWSGQVEPFLQLPLGGVGAGQVRLSSLGAAFSLKFGLFR